MRSVRAGTGIAGDEVRVGVTVVSVLVCVIADGGEFCVNNFGEVTGG